MSRAVSNRRAKIYFGRSLELAVFSNGQNKFWPYIVALTPCPWAQAPPYCEKSKQADELEKIELRLRLQISEELRRLPRGDS